MTQLDIKQQVRIAEQVGNMRLALGWLIMLRAADREICQLNRIFELKDPRDDR